MKKLILAAVLLFGINALAQLPNYQNWCQQGGKPVSVSGLNSTRPFQESYPRCTITVYVHGVGTPCSGCLFQDAAGTVPLSNPFTANSNGSFQFYAAAGRYDVQESDCVPSCGLISPVTFSDVGLGSGGGGSAPASPLGSYQVYGSSTSLASTANVLAVTAFPGGDCGAQINAAVTALSPGGTVDARGLTAGSVCTTPVALNKPLKLLIGQSLTFSPTPGTQVAGIVISAPNVTVECDASKVFTSTPNGIVLTSGTAVPLIANFADAVVSGNYHTADGSAVTNCGLAGGAVGTFGIFFPTSYTTKIHGVHASNFTSAPILALAAQNDLYNTVADTSGGDGIVWGVDGHVSGTSQSNGNTADGWHVFGGSNVFDGPTGYQNGLHGFHADGVPSGDWVNTTYLEPKIILPTGGGNAGGYEYYTQQVGATGGSKPGSFCQQVGCTMGDGSVVYINIGNGNEYGLGLHIPYGGDQNFNSLNMSQSNFGNHAGTWCGIMDEGSSGFYNINDSILGAKVDQAILPGNPACGVMMQYASSGSIIDTQFYGGAWPTGSIVQDKGGVILNQVFDSYVGATNCIHPYGNCVSLANADHNTVVGVRSNDAGVSTTPTANTYIVTVAATTSGNTIDGVIATDDRTPPYQRGVAVANGATATFIKNEQYTGTASPTDSGLANFLQELLGGNNGLYMSSPALFNWTVNGVQAAHIDNTGLAVDFGIFYLPSTYSNGCLTVTGQVVSSTGSPCASGGPVASPQFQVPYYSASGTASTLTGDPGLITDGAGNFKATQLVANDGSGLSRSLDPTKPNSASPGTTRYFLAKVVSGVASIASTSDTGLTLFAVDNDATASCAAGTTGNACLVFSGDATLTVDAGGLAANHYFGESTVTNGAIKDLGATPGPVGCLGKAEATIAGSATGKVYMGDCGSAANAAPGFTFTTVNFSGIHTITAAEFSGVSNFGQRDVYTGSGSGSFTLPASGLTPPANSYLLIKNLSTSQLTLSAGAGTTLVGTSPTFNQYESALVVWDGTQYAFDPWRFVPVTWPTLQGGTNNSSGFICGTGCSISTSGSGTNAATSVPAAGIGAGTAGISITGSSTSLSTSSAIPNGSTATTQTLGDNSTLIATDAFVIANSSAGSGNNFIDLVAGVMQGAGCSVNNSYLTGQPVTPFCLAGSSTFPSIAAPEFPTAGAVGTGTALLIGPRTVPSNYTTNGNIVLHFGIADPAATSGTVTFKVRMAAVTPPGVLQPTFCTTDFSTGAVTVSGTINNTVVGTATVVPNAAGCPTVTAGDQIWFQVYLQAKSASQTPYLGQLYMSY